MKAYYAFCLIPVSVVVVLFCASPAYAAQSQQAGDPSQQCVEGIRFFLQEKQTEALPLLEAGFNGRKNADFADPEDLGYCAFVLGILRNSTGNPTGALEAYQVALLVFQSSHNREFEGMTLNNLGDIYNAQDQYANALEYYQQALIIRKEINDRAGEGITLNSLGTIYYSQAKYAQALEYFQQALAIYRELGDQEGEGIMLNNLGEVYRALGQSMQALDYYQQALVINKEVGNRVGEGRTLTNIGAAYASQGEYKKALNYYQQAIIIQSEIGDWVGEGATLNNLGALNHSQGQYVQALDYYQQTLAIYRELGERAGEGVILNNIGLIYGAQGQYAQALDYFQRALIIHQEVGNRADEGITFNSIGGIYNSQGQYAQALDNFQQALLIAREVGDQSSEGEALNNLGAVYTSQGQYEEALNYYQQALVIRRESGDRIGESNAFNNLGTIHAFQLQYAQALEYYNQALAISRELNDKVGEGAVLNNIGSVYRTQGQYEQALNYFQEALVIQGELGNQVGKGEAVDNIGEIYQTQGQYTKSLEYYQIAIAIFEELRTIAGDDAARTSFIAQYADLYQRAVSVAHQLQQDEQAFAFSEQGRARSFLDALTTGAVELSDKPAAELITREQEAYASWLAAQDALAKAKAQNQPDPRLISNLETQLADAKQVHMEALQAIEARGDELSALVPGRSTVLSLAEVQNLLDDQTTLVSYFVVDDNSGGLAFIITRDSFSVIELLNATPTKLKTTVEGILPSLQDTHPQSMQDLYTWLISPIKDQIKTPRVGIIPHLTLHYIPFAALSDGQTYFGEQYELFLLPSASSLRYIQQHAAQATNSGAVVFGNPSTNETGLPILPYAEAEAVAVATTLGVRDYTGTTATELQLHESIVGSAVLHLAVHGAYNQYNPLYSALYLAPDIGGQYDGRLEVHEIFGLDLKGSQLVVLSACETQLGQLSTGDEVVGMTRAFMFAGTPSVLASLWQVDDEATQVLMISFYKHWREDGMNKAQALQAAQADVRANPKWESPYYWAAFVLSGDVGKTSIQSTTTDAPSNPICPSAMLTPIVFIFGIFTIKRHLLHKGVR